MEIIRRIYADGVEDIDLSNLGCHWTSCESSFSKKGAFGYTQQTGKIGFKVYAKVTQSMLDIAASSFSNERYPHEKEVIVRPNTQMEIVIWNPETCEDDYEGPANTGSRIEKWVDNFHNGITD